MEHGKNFRARVDGQPEPEHLFGTAEAGAQFVQLEVREVEMEEEALVQSVRVCTCTSEPGGDRGLTIAETRSAAEGSSPSARAESTMAICCEGVFKRYKGVFRLEVTVERQA